VTVPLPVSPRHAAQNSLDGSEAMVKYPTAGNHPLAISKAFGELASTTVAKWILEIRCSFWAADTQFSFSMGILFLDE
jgi:hypothetical protein